MHRLDCLLKPKSIALVGASNQRDSVGNEMLLEMRRSGYAGRIYPVNPKYQEIEGYACFPSLSALPETVDLAMLALSNERLEATVDEVIRLGIRAVIIFSSGILANETESTLIARLQHKAAQSGVVVCGVNCMGFYNHDHALRAFIQYLPRDLQPGHITYLSQSGSALTALLWNDQKLKFNLAVSTGQELNTSVADFMDYALQQESTRVIALFLETVRDPAMFVAALSKARDKAIPIVVLKAGRTESGAAMAISHTGAIAGNDAVFEALFDRYGVIRVRSLDELAATAQLLSGPYRAALGGLAAILDSGGEREVLVDLADDMQVPMATINEQTTATLAEHLDVGLDPINPLDAWGTGANYPAIYETCLQALMDDPDTALGILAADLTSGFSLHENFAVVARRVAQRTKKPLAVLTNHVGTDSQDLAKRIVAEGVPVLDGTETGLLAIKHALAYRDFRLRPTIQAPAASEKHIIEFWRKRLGENRALDESEGLQLLQAYGINTPTCQLSDSLNNVLIQSKDIGFPLALKTAMQGILHKSDVGGVKLNINNETELKLAYGDMVRRLGPKVLLAPMISGDIEIAFGMINDAQFGPLLMVSSGGIYIEMFKDRQLALAPVDKVAAKKLIQNLAIWPILQGIRGAPAYDIEGLATALVNMGRLATELGDLIREMDVNPLKLGHSSCIAVDALVITNN
jgi:acyl-CoA synthetase (NDP forming)